MKGDGIIQGHHGLGSKRKSLEEYKQGRDSTLEKTLDTWAQGPHIDLAKEAYPET